MRKNTAWAILSLLMLATPTLAQRESKAESWYTYWGLGAAFPMYPTELQNVLDLIKDQSGVKNTAIDFDMLGFYWPVMNHQTAVGFIINGGGDRYEYHGEWFQINQYLYGLSAMHFPGHTIGQGLFVRVDAGIAVMNIQDSDGSNESSDRGTGFLLGGGYGLPIANGGTRLLFNGNYAWKKVEGETYSKISLNLGFLF